MKPGRLPAVVLSVVLPVVVPLEVMPGVLAEVLPGVLPGVLPRVLPVVLPGVLALVVLPEVLRVVLPELLPWGTPFCPAGESHPAEQQKHCCKQPVRPQVAGNAPKSITKPARPVPCHPTPSGIHQQVFLTHRVVYTRQKSHWWPTASRVGKNSLKW